MSTLAVLPAEDPKVKLDLTSYFAKRPPGVLHCTTKFTDFGKAMGADEYAQQEVSVLGLFFCFFLLSKTCVQAVCYANLLPG